MPKVCIVPSNRQDQYPNGGGEDYWMSQIAKAAGPFLSALGVELQPRCPSRGGGHG